MINPGRGFTTMEICKAIPQLPGTGVKVYTERPASVVLIEEGLQVPLIPSFDVGGSVVAVSCWQYEPDMVGKVGEMVLAIVTFIEAGVEQLSAGDGVNLYVVVPIADVLMPAGLHVPLIPSFDCSGSTGAIEF
jgi:hypothetical protein